MRFSFNHTLGLPILRAALAFLLLVPGCSGAARRDLSPLLERMAEPEAAWSGEVLSVSHEDLPRLREILVETETDPDLFAFLSAELDVLEGYFHRGFERYGDLLATHPADLWGALAALRMTQISYLVADFYLDVPQVLDRIRQGQIHPLTAHFASLLELQADFSRHERIGASPSGPFDGGPTGMPSEWRHAGPFSALPYLHLERHEPYDDDPVLADTYDLDGRLIRTRRFLGNDLEVRPAVPGPGTYLFETWAHLDGPSDRILVLESYQPVIVRLDEQIVLTRQVGAGYDPTVLMRPVHLEAGWHRLRVKLGVVEGQPSFRVRLIHPRLEGSGPSGVEPVEASALRFAGSPPQGVQMSGSMLSVEGHAGLQQMLPAAVVEATDPASAYVLLLFSAAFNEEGLVRRAVDALPDETERSPLVDTTLAWFAGQQQTLDPRSRESTRLMHTRLALEHAPSAGSAALSLAGLLSEQGWEEEALQVLGAAVEKVPQEEGMVLGLIELYLSQGWDELAEPELLRLLQAHPEACGLVERLIRVYEMRDHAPDLDRLPLGFQTCRAGLEYQLEHLLLPRGEHGDALRLMRILTEHHPEVAEYHRNMYDLFMGLGRPDEARDQMVRACRYAWEPSVCALYEADWLLAQDREREGRQRLQDLLENELVGESRLLMAQAFLDGTSLLEELRVDTREAIEAYRQRGTNLRAATVFALDYAAYRFFEGGSGLAVTHQIIHIQSREALAQVGEVAIPTNALLLKARTIKADGRILEPDNIPGKTTVSLPNLEVGDFAEFEYLELLAPSSLRGNTTLQGRFYFQLPDCAFSRSELVVEVPSDWPALIVDRRGAAPEPEVTRTDGQQRYRFTVYDSTPPVIEPGAPAADEYLTSVRLASGIEWEDIRDAYLDRMLGVVRFTPLLDATTRSVLSESTVPRMRIERIFRFVMNQVEETGGFLSSHAIWTLMFREGERLPLLLAMLRSAGFQADMVFLRSWEDDQTDSPIPDGNRYPETALRVRSDGEELWLYPAQERIAFDYLPPELQGVEAMVIDSTGAGAVQWLTTPHWPEETNLIQIEMDLRLDENGDVQGTVVERNPIRLAAGMRWMLEQVQDQQTLVMQLEQQLSATFSGAVVSALDIEQVEEDDLPLVFHYSFHATRFARRQGEQVIIEARVFDRQIREYLGAVPRRTVPLSVPFPYLEELSVRIQLPPGYRFTSVPPPFAIEHDQLQYSWSIVHGGLNEETVHLVRTTRIPIGRVSPDQYPALLEQLLRLDQATTLHLAAGPQVM
ncbi:MAG: hypothetical protein JW797_12795 [Bradymonadales bacterium]|nr:hypothetical protein [Bradymonadales bacterium]